MVQKNILIIGASGEIGQATATRLARDGHCLILHYNQNRSGIETILQHVEATRILSVIQSDLGFASGSEKVLEAIPFRVDAIIFAAGNAYTGLFQETSEPIMDRMLMTHVKSPWMITKGLLPSMIQSGSGTILFITSIWAEHGGSMEVVYSAVKGAQNSFVKALGKEVANTGVSVNAISPGYIETRMNAHLTEAEKDALFQDIPLKRPGTPNDIARIVSFFLNETAGIKGTILQVDGGWIPD